MEIGERLKNARTEHGLTQEQVAEELGVSRQSISNWENNRAYPDIVSVIKLSDLYSVSLDELLKEDKKMIRHLAETTNMAANNERLLKRLAIAAYWVCWGLVFLIYGLIAIIPESTPLINFNGLLCYVPVTVAFAFVTVTIGLTGDVKSKWLYIPITGAIFVLYAFIIWYVCTEMSYCAHWNAGWIACWGDTRPEGLQYFNLSKSIGEFFSSDGIEFHAHALTACLCGMFGSAFGILIGSYIRNTRTISTLGKKERNEDNNAPLGENPDI